MPSYTLYYFNGRGRAEVLRMLFSAAGVQFQDKRIEFSEWSHYKSKAPCRCLPYLEIDSATKIPESMAISRYLAREFGFHGRTNMDIFRVDYICDCFYDIFHDYMRWFHEKHGRFRTGCCPSLSSCIHHHDRDNDMKLRYIDTCRRILPFLEMTLGSFNGGKQYFMGEQIMLCDMMCYCCLEGPMRDNPSLMNGYPNLMALRQRVSSHPKISMYLKKRSHSDW
ncbi:S-crystallin SL20-1-like [Octopus sinensis]|uniref:S-crystallin SL20-1-like n=1 Tax=Octopus sinensis TaxID=2607531 RepID=A0A7E6ETS5_9MOLL|nr:S-crystallin SL20-1-like [Octopus sinensis]